jgi:hypothetical protein
VAHFDGVAEGLVAVGIEIGRVFGALCLSGEGEIGVDVARKAEKLDGSKLRLGGNCQMKGPRRSPRARGPEAKKPANASSQFLSRLMWVTSCGPLIEN